MSSYNERQLTSELSRKIRSDENLLPHTCAIELKLCRKNRLNWKSDLQNHQAYTLFKVRYQHLGYKISDLASFGGSLPFDYVYFKNAPAYLAVCFYEPRQPKILYFISAGTLTSLIMSTKSITKSQAEAYSDFTITL